MTLIRSQRNTERTNTMLLLGVAFLITMIVLSIFFYTTNVNLRYVLSSLSEEITRLDTDNAESRDLLYSQLDFENLEILASDLGLVKENTPEYLLALQ